jgi:hypothetical protein
MLFANAFAAILADDQSSTRLIGRFHKAEIAIH